MKQLPVVCLACVLLCPGVAGADPIVVEYWNIKAGYEKPVVVANPKFLGFFIPVFGTNYQVCLDGECVTFEVLAHPSGLTGARYEQGRHDGWDILGWFDTDCSLHLFEDGSYTVQMFRDGKLQVSQNETIRFDSTSHAPPKFGDYYAHVTPNDAINNAIDLQLFKAGDDIGTINGNHLHFEVRNYETGKSIDPIAFWERGTKTCEFCVPEPASLLLLGGGLVGLGVWRKRRHSE